ncbi:MAG: T3SS effector HopA1 family protein [Bacteroidia bacterium]
MNLTILQQIEKTAEAFSVKNDSVFFGNDDTGIQVNDFEASEKIQKLSDIIYRNCYCRNQFSSQKAELTSLTGNESERLLFISKLNEANKTQDILDKGWSIEEIDESGTLLVSKKEFQMITTAGNYLNQSRIISEIRPLDKIMIRMLRDSQQSENHFYFINGMEQHEWWLTGSVRFYWNLKKEGAALLLESVSSQFNRFGIPFGFKCCSDPHSYSRNDSGVLYLANCYFNIGIKILKDIHKNISEFLKESVPLFTLKIAKGLSFAENPPSHQISFGQSRSRIIARGLWKAWNQNAVAEKISDAVKQSINENDLNPEKFYLNPRSCYEYDFTGFD